MSPDEVYRVSNTPEAKALRHMRQQRCEGPRGAGSRDPLAERQRLAQFWTDCNSTNPAYGLVHARPIYRHPGFRCLVLPGLRAWLCARERARKDAFRDEMRRQSAEWRAKKALKVAAKRAKSLQLFEVPA
jgi:hypothetical protein